VGWELAVALTAIGVIVLGVLIWQARSAARSKALLKKARADAAAREDFDAAVEDWDGAGGLASGMRDPE
jgi:hypothetical protein